MIPSVLHTVTALAALGAMAPVANAHMALWHPSTYGHDVGTSSQRTNPVWPLSERSFNDWWFHGNLHTKPSQIMTIPAGRTLNVELACGKQHSTFGNRPNADACMNDSGAYHAGGQTNDATGWTGNREDQLMGCALAIAYKSDPTQVKPEDFTVFSVQHRCVRQRDTPFEVPANMPACPGGECTCAWFWQGRNSREEMYMTAFRCNVRGVQAGAGAIPVPAAPRRGGRISGPTQPMYWANGINNIGYTPDWNSRPRYNLDFGWVDGAQTSAFGPINNNHNANPLPAPPASSAAAPVPAPAPAPTTTNAPPADDEELVCERRKRKRSRSHVAAGH